MLLRGEGGGGLVEAPGVTEAGEVRGLGGYNKGGGCSGHSSEIRV